MGQERKKNPKIYKMTYNLSVLKSMFSIFVSTILLLTRMNGQSKGGTGSYQVTAGNRCRRQRVFTLVIRIRIKETSYIAKITLGSCHDRWHKNIQSFPQEKGQIDWLLADLMFNRVVGSSPQFEQYDIYRNNQYRVNRWTN